MIGTGVALTPEQHKSGTRGMNGVHDMGGMHGFGPIDPEPNEPVFHDDLGGAGSMRSPRPSARSATWTLDADRHATETDRTGDDLSQRLLLRKVVHSAMHTLLLAGGYANETELATGNMEMPAKPVEGVLRADRVEDYVHNVPGIPARLKAIPPVSPSASRSAPATSIRTGHTRLPRYVRGHVGTRSTGFTAATFSPTAMPMVEGEQPQWLYSVRFSAAELWGDRPAGSDRDLFIDLWEPYLDPRQVHTPKEHRHMNGAQDLGGMQGFGPVDPEPDEPVFHREWERRVFALTLAMGFTGQWNIDISRHARESLDPAQYLSSSYYQIWLAGLQKLLVRNDLVSREELASGKASAEPVELSRILAATDVERMLGTRRSQRTRNRGRTRLLPSATTCAPATSTRRATPACPAMPADAPAPYRRSAGATCSPTPTPTARASSRNGSIR